MTNPSALPAASPQATTWGYLPVCDANGSWWVCKMMFGPGVGSASWTIASGPYTTWLMAFQWYSQHMTTGMDNPPAPPPYNTPMPPPVVT